jgi:hypothetical protein
MTNEILGGIAGSLMLNRRFDEHVMNIVGEEEMFRLRKTTAYSTAMKQWDHEVKQTFTNDPSKEWYVSFPMAELTDDAANHLKNDFLLLKW